MGIANCGPKTTGRYADPTVTPDDINAIVDAITGAYVPRNTAGTPTALGADLGSATYPWKYVYLSTTLRLTANASGELAVEKYIGSAWEEVGTVGGA